MSCNDTDGRPIRPFDPSAVERIGEAALAAASSLAREAGFAGDHPRLRDFSGVLDAAFELARSAARQAHVASEELRVIHRIARIGSWRVALDDRRATWSEEMHALFGTDPERFIPSADALLQKLDPRDRNAFAEAFDAVIARRTGVAIEVRVPGRDEPMRWFWVDMLPESDSTGTPAAVRGICQDITERKAALERIRYVASHDPVTGLINRPHLIERLDLVLAEADRRRESVALLRFDLDAFSGIGDMFGHAVGDSVLREVALRIGRRLREQDIAAHIGGDEFVVVQTGGARTESAEALARRLLDAIAAPMTFPGHPEIAVSASVGIAIHPRDGATPDLLMTHSAQALHCCRARCGNSLGFYHPSMDAEWQERRSLEQSLRFALPNGEFSLAYQPLFCMSTSSCTGFEALLRWNSPVHGLVPPDMFIGIAESIGLMEPLGAWVLCQACREAARWATPLAVAVNVSPIQIQQGDLAGTIARVLAETGLAPGRLEIEVTETLLIHGPDRALETLRRIRALGVRVSIDDFGTGYSSLATLRAFPFDKLKVDRSFVCDLGEASESQAIINAVIGLGRGLRLPVVIEGVETEQQARILRDCGADMIQGYLVGRPLPIACFGTITNPAGEPASAAECGPPPPHRACTRPLPPARAAWPGHRATPAPRAGQAG